MTTTKPDWANKLPEYQHWRHIPGKGWCATQRMMFAWGLFVGITEHLYSYRYCFEHEADAIKALETWDGNGDAPGPWIKRRGLGGDKLNPNFIRDAKAPVNEIRGDDNYGALLGVALDLAFDNARETTPAFEGGGGSTGGGGAGGSWNSSDSYSSDPGSSGGGE